jgi:hypothetical protein
LLLYLESYYEESKLIQVIIIYGKPCRKPSLCVNGVCEYPLNYCNPVCPKGFTCVNNQCIPNPGICTPACEAGYQCVSSLGQNICVSINRGV